MSRDIKLPVMHDPKFVTRLAIKLILNFGETFKNSQPLPTDLELVEKWIDSAIVEETIMRWAS